MIGIGIDIALKEQENGPFGDQAVASQVIKDLCRECGIWGDLTDMQKESLDMIAHKIARILAGNQDNKDHWDDIAGYASLVSKELNQ